MVYSAVSLIQSASAWWNKVAAAFAVAVVPDHVAGAPPEASELQVVVSYIARLVKKTVLRHGVVV